MHGCREKIPTMQEVFEAYLEGEDNGLEMLSGLGESEKEKVIDTAIRMLEGLFGDGSSFDRESAVKALEQAILELNLGLSGEEIHQLAEALTDLYVNAYQEVYTSEQKTQTTVKHLESSVTAQMEENLSSVSEHLTQLDLQIQDNQNTLEQVFSQGESLGTSVENLKEKTELIREQVSESMKEIGEGLSRVDQAVGQTQEKLEQYHAAHEETIRESSKRAAKAGFGRQGAAGRCTGNPFGYIKRDGSERAAASGGAVKAVSGIGRCGQKDTGAVNGNRGERTESACRARYRFKGRDG